MKLINRFFICVAGILALTACSSDEPEPQTPPLDTIYAGTANYKTHLLEAADNANGEEFNKHSYKFRAPKEGGTFKFKLSDDAVDIMDTGNSLTSTPLESFDFIPTAMAEIKYGSTPDTDMCCLFESFHLIEEYVISSFVNTDKSPKIETDWLKYDSHVGDNSFIVTIPENNQGHTRQFNIWFGRFYLDGSVATASYGLVIIQE